ncbi:hypothetical protein [Nonlabens agnitus]|nr:hypothetical protein [Nonlabens agnitus]
MSTEKTPSPKPGKDAPKPGKPIDQDQDGTPKTGVVIGPRRDGPAI